MVSLAIPWCIVGGFAKAIHFHLSCSSLLELATQKGLLHKIRGRGARVRTSLYANNATVFMTPIKRNIDNLATILKGYNEVTGLCTNFQKSSVVPIQCNQLNLGHILQRLPATRASSPLTYLGLPLSVWQLKKVDLHFLENKVAGKLVTWEGQHITTSGRTTLVKSVVTSQVVYFTTPLVVLPSTPRF